MENKIMGVTIITEAPDEKGYFYSSLELPATNIQIEDALHKARWLKDTKTWFIHHNGKNYHFYCAVNKQNQRFIALAVSDR